MFSNVENFDVSGGATAQTIDLNELEAVSITLRTGGGIDTPLLEDVKGPYLDFVLSKMPIGRLGRAEETASLICWLASEENSFSSGAVFDNSGGRAVY